MVISVAQQESRKSRIYQLSNVSFLYDYNLTVLTVVLTKI